jgi:hypothetical protein
MADDNIQPDSPGRPARDWDRERDRDRGRRGPRYDDEDDLDVRRRDSGGTGLIPYRNPQALIAYYCGVFALIPCLGLALGPVALILGILGLNYKKKNPSAGGTGHAIAGIVLGTVVLFGHLAFFLLFSWFAPFG